MKAVQILGTPESHEIVLSDSQPAPVPRGKEILVKVHASGLTADEVTWPEVYKTPSRIPGHDISGVVEQLGPDYQGPMAVGDSVFAMLHADRGQGQAEYVAVLPDEIAHKPASISHVQAAALPIPVLTAWEALSDHAKLSHGAKILVTGASGAVGLQLVQLAKKLFDAEIIALASQQHHALLHELGASETCDYKTPDWEKSITGLDAVFDMVGGTVLGKTWGMVKSKGVIVTVADPPPPWAFGGGAPVELKTYPDVRYVYFVLSPSSEILEKAARLIDEGALEPLPVIEYAVSEAVEAWKLAANRGRAGKVVINFTSDTSS